MKTLAELRSDAPLAVAVAAASMAALLSTGDHSAVPNGVLDWPRARLDAVRDPDTLFDDCRPLADFVRGNPTARPADLFAASDAIKARDLQHGWNQQPAWVTAAFGTFRDVLLAADQRMAGNLS